MCARTFFDPMPSYGHVAAIAFVPLSNFVIWMHLQHGGRWSVKRLIFAQGIAIASIYALLFLPLAPIALVAILAGIGLLPLAPLATFICALRLRTALTRAYPDVRLGRPLLGGLAGGLALLAALDVPPSVTRCVLFRFGVIKVMTALALSLVLAIVCNVLRASSLFYVEAGLVAQAPAWWHEGIGIAAFTLSAIATLWLLTRLRGREALPCAA